MKKKHILVITQYFYPEQFRINDMCAEWVKRGYEVTVVTGYPNYPQGEYYDGYGWFKHTKQKWKGVKIIRLPLTERKQGSVRLAMNYFSFVVSGFFWALTTNIKADYVFTFEVSPMTQALIGVWYAKRRKIPHYLYVQDLWPENVEIVTGIHSSLVLKPIGAMVNYIYKHCDIIFATSPSFVKEIQKRVKKNKDKVKYLPQYAEEFYRPVPRKPVSEIPEDDSFKIIFTGNIGKAQGLDILPKAAKLLKGKENVKFVIVGDGRDKDNFLKQIADNDVQDMFIMIDRQPPTRIPELLAACDAAFISFMPDPLFEKTIPAKLQSYMACGMPIIASANGETKRIIDEAKCGVCVELGNAQALSKAITEMACSDMVSASSHSRDYFDEHFEKQKLMSSLDDYYIR
ncbi:glycosyl transferase family 1 [Ruminococcus albus SY3]|uniref:Glycosyl transferase family 1 n=1 Tax=Ruminococcus albus SY3 TaxID=1341156 RepID=A0A011UJ25_RUMAL|nr:glycosyltransferase family 4 protein [Ruminococcus albus]EXM38187.1 glycosyl transferase family 1 [Ruminococcus albus SY3]EXM40674.1 glycosyl transferase family 1 [Ruminococcus albus SY3]